MNCFFEYFPLAKVLRVHMMFFFYVNINPLFIYIFFWLSPNRYLVRSVSEATRRLGAGGKEASRGRLHDFAEGGGGEAAGGRRRPLLCAFVCFPLLLFVQYFFHPKLEECPACSRFAFILKKKRIFLPHFEIGIFSR